MENKFSQHKSKITFPSHLRTLFFTNFNYIEYVVISLSLLYLDVLRDSISIAWVSFYVTLVDLIYSSSEINYQVFVLLNYLY